MNKYLSLVLILATQDVFAHAEPAAHTHFLGLHLPEILALMAVSVIASALIGKRLQAKKID